MNNPWPSIAVAVVLVAIGCSLMASHLRTWRRQEADPALDEREQNFYRRRYRRRMQIAALFDILGVLIGLGDAVLPLQKQQPGPVTLYWIGVLALTGWVVLLALADMWATAAFSRSALTRLHERRRELERQVVEFKHRLRLEDSSGDSAAETR